MAKKESDFRVALSQWLKTYYCSILRKLVAKQSFDLPGFPSGQGGHTHPLATRSVKDKSCTAQERKEQSEPIIYAD